jgi:hypothetical protein
MAKKTSAGGAFRFRVSDSVDVPLRGRMLRLRVLEGAPAMSDLKPGRRLRIAGPGDEGMVRIVAHSVTSGKATQQRLDTVRELDLVVADERPATATPIGIGWFASGPVNDRDEG